MVTGKYSHYIGGSGGSEGRSEGEPRRDGKWRKPRFQSEKRFCIGGLRSWVGLAFL